MLHKHSGTTIQVKSYDAYQGCDWNDGFTMWMHHRQEAVWEEVGLQVEPWMYGGR